ncbi:MAG: 4-(cytidine 5'-diphospho)-2-C-methyl-D-erythritol kinase [Muribaculaceae bacterium]|nr:4-(cytidine 5'-diphospho)-2-C-methyl-D-erythritol kinase [Muribaculaceae bacterium]
MIKFPNAKINLGLDIVEKRADGYHNIESVFYPIPLCDALEIVPSSNHGATLHVSGNAIECEPKDNLVIKAYNKLACNYPIPAVDIYLHKNIPDGAGLGGGSADASFTLIILNELFNLNIDNSELASIASTIGADCPFFIYNKPVLATGIGNIFSSIELSLNDKYLLLIKPDVYVSTKDAYSGVTPQLPTSKIQDIISSELSTWKGQLKNDFESSVFAKFPQLLELKEKLYSLGATYASMSGSGSSIYGIFESANMADTAKNNFSDIPAFVLPLK